MIPLGILLIPALLITLGILVLGVLTTWALFRYGGDFGAFFGSMLYWAATVLVVGVAWTYLAPVNWFEPLMNTAAFFQTPF